MRTRYRYDADLDAVVPIGGGSNYYEEEKTTGPNVISDDVGAGVKGLRHMPSGKMLDSKSAHRRETKAAGLEECGNDNPASKQPEPHRDYYGNEVKAAAEQLDGNWNGTADWARQDRERVEWHKRNQR